MRPVESTHTTETRTSIKGFGFAPLANRLSNVNLVTSNHLVHYSGYEVVSRHQRGVAFGESSSHYYITPIPLMLTLLTREFRALLQ